MKGHFNSLSQQAPLTLRLKGQWKVKGVAEAWTEADGESTLLTVKCKDGASMEVELEESNDPTLFEAAKALNWKAVFSSNSVHITASKTGERLFFNVEDDGNEKLFEWQSPLIGEVTEGRIGLRHMWMKSARYNFFMASVLEDGYATYF